MPRQPSSQPSACRACAPRATRKTRRPSCTPTSSSSSSSSSSRGASSSSSSSSRGGEGVGACERRKAGGPKRSKGKRGGVGFSSSCKDFDGMTASARGEGLDKKFAGLKTLHPYHPEVGKMARL